MTRLLPRPPPPLPLYLQGISPVYGRSPQCPNGIPNSPHKGQCVRAGSPLKTRLSPLHESIVGGREEAALCVALMAFDQSDPGNKEIRWSRRVVFCTTAKSKCDSGRGRLYRLTPALVHVVNTALSTNQHST